MRERLIQAFTDLGNSIVAAVPQVIVGVVLIIVAIFVASMIEKMSRYALTKLNIDKLVGRAGVDQALRRLGLRQELASFLPRLIYFMVLLLLAKTSADALGLVAISDAIGAFFGYLPNIVAALLLLILGSTVGGFAGDTVSRAAEESGIDFAASLGRLVSGLILFVTAMMAIAQLRIDTEMVRIVTSFILGGAALAFGLAVGLGSRDIVRNIAAGVYNRKILQVGAPVQIAGEQGVVRAITATHVILESATESGRQETKVSNTTFLEQVAKQQVEAQ